MLGDPHTVNFMSPQKVKLAPSCCFEKAPLTRMFFFSTAFQNKLTGLLQGPDSEPLLLFKEDGRDLLHGTSSHLPFLAFAHRI